MAESVLTDEIPKLYHPDRLEEICTKAIAVNFKDLYCLDSIPHQYVEDIVAQIDLGTLPLLKCCKLIQAEKLWEALSKYRWKEGDLDVSKHGCSWKNLYLEKHCALLFETYYPSPDNGNWEMVSDHIRAASAFLHTLRIRQMLSHCPLEHALTKLPNLFILDINYGNRSLGLDFDKERLGMAVEDANSLCKVLSGTQSIGHLRACESNITDELMTLIAHGLEQNDTVTHLDLSHNKISNLGCTKLGKWLGKETVCTQVFLQNNRIGFQGISVLAKSLMTNTTLTCLNLRLNRIGDKGGAAIFKCLQKNTTLQILNVSSNELKEESAREFVQMILKNKTLTTIDVSCNNLAKMKKENSEELENTIEPLKAAIAKSESLLKMDLRKTGLGKHTLSSIEKLIAPRLISHRQGLRKVFLNEKWEDIQFSET